MKTDKTNLGALNDLLRRADSILGAAASMIKDIEFDTSSNIRRIGTALAEIYEVQQEIYKAQPDLTPPLLRSGKRRKS